MAGSLEKDVVFATINKQLNRVRGRGLLQAWHTLDRSQSIIELDISLVSTE